MQLHIRFSGMLLVLAGTKEVFLDVEENGTLREALIALQHEVKPEFTEQVLKPLLDLQITGPLTLLLKNRKHVQNLQELDEIIHPNDSLAFLPPMEGGI